MQWTTLERLARRLLVVEVRLAACACMSRWGKGLRFDGAAQAKEPFHSAIGACKWCQSVAESCESGDASKSEGAEHDRLQDFGDVIQAGSGPGDGPNRIVDVHIVAILCPPLLGLFLIGPGGAILGPW